MNLSALETWLTEQIKPVTSIAAAMYQPRLFRVGEEDAAHREMAERQADAQALQPCMLELGALLEKIADPLAAIEHLRTLTIDLVDIAKIADFVDTTRQCITLLEGCRSRLVSSAFLDAEVPTGLQAVSTLIAVFRTDHGFRIRPTLSPKLMERKTAYADVYTKLHAAFEAEYAALAAARIPVHRESEWIVERSEYEACEKDVFANHVRILSEKKTFLVCTLRKTPEIRELEEHVAAIEGDILTAQDEVLAKTAIALERSAQTILRAARWIATLDAELRLASFVQLHPTIVPEIRTEAVFSVTNVHFLPLVLSLSERYKPISFIADPACSIVGANMGGKSTALLTCAFVAMLVQRGIPIPAESATVALVDDIVELQGSLAPREGLSSFGDEMIRLAQLLQAEPKRRLVLVDEFCRTTGVAEGRAIVTAIVQWAVTQGHLVVAATHFDRVARLVKIRQYRVAGLARNFVPRPEATLAERLQVLSAELDRQLLADDTERPEADAFRIAAALGITDDFLRRAEHFYV